MKSLMEKYENGPNEDDSYDEEYDYDDAVENDDEDSSDEDNDENEDYDEEEEEDVRVKSHRPPYRLQYQKRNIIHIPNIRRLPITRKNRRN
jgi:hypothetical protein